MTAPSLPAALRAGAQGGRYALEAAAGLLIAYGTWLARDDVRDHVLRGTGTAAIDWESVTQALATGSLPASGEERRMLQLAARGRVASGKFWSDIAERGCARSADGYWSRPLFNPGLLQLWRRAAKQEPGAACTDGRSCPLVMAAGPGGYPTGRGSRPRG